MLALRAARAFTGKDAVIKIAGGYYGSHDVAKVNRVADTGACGLPSRKIGRGLPTSTGADVVIAPFNGDLISSSAAIS